MKKHVTLVALILLLTCIAQVASAVILNVHGPDNQNTRLEIELTDSIDSIMAKIEDKLGIPRSRQVLKYNDILLEEGRTLNDYGITADDTITLTVLGKDDPIVVPSEASETIDDTTEPATRWQQARVTGVHKWANVRDGAGLNYAVIDTLPLGEPLSLMYWRGEWCFVLYANETKAGWMYQSVISASN